MPKARILAVDDQLYFRVFLEEMLEEEGYAIETVGSPEAVLERVGREHFDLVLTDLAMPGTDGCELVRRLKERAPETEIVVLTGVGDVRTAVEAMKFGATDYLVKPVERPVLARVLDGILQQRRMREEHASLLAENLEFMGAVSLYERAFGLFSTLDLEPLVDRIVEGLCLETHAHGGVLWLARPDDGPARLRLLGARGLVRLQLESEVLELGALPESLAALRNPGARPFLAEAAPGQEGRRALYVPLREQSSLLGFARLTDRLDGAEFDELDLAAAEKFSAFAGQAVANALALRGLERRSFRDPTTRAYTRAYFDDVARNELRRAARFGRTFSLVRLELDGSAALRTSLTELEFGAWLEKVALQVGRCLRASDLLAAESESRFCLLLPETDALGAAILKQRIRAAFQRSELAQQLEESERPTLLLASATFPAEGTEIEEMWKSLESRLDEDRRSPLRSLEALAPTLGAVAEALLAEAQPGRPESLEQIMRFMLAEVARRPHERGLLFVAPGASLVGATRAGLEQLRGLAPATEIVVVAERRESDVPGLPVTWIPPERSALPRPFLVYYGEGAPYALLRDERSEGSGELHFYHSSDRTLVEQLAFQLGRDLGIPIGD